MELLVGFYFVAVSSVMPVPSGAAVSSMTLPQAETASPAPVVPDEAVQELPERPAAFQQVLAIPVPRALSAPARDTKCHPGKLVMIPDGREGTVTSWDGKVCRVLAYGEAYVSLFNEDMIEPLYPQLLPKYNFGH